MFVTTKARLPDKSRAAKEGANKGVVSLKSKWKTNLEKKSMKVVRLSKSDVYLGFSGDFFFEFFTDVKQPLYHLKRSIATPLSPIFPHGRPLSSTTHITVHIVSYLYLYI